MTGTTRNPAKVLIIGGGFTGLAAAYELGLRGVRPIVVEREPTLGGLAGGFVANGQLLEKFYHHWFTSDEHIFELVRELGLEDRLQIRASQTGFYYRENFYDLSTPTDVLQFDALSFVGRLRLGWLAVKARFVRSWEELEGLTAEEWIRDACGDEVYEIVWEPLLRGKFGPYAERVSAVWFWNKLILRGGSRGSKGEERLAYYRGGFAAFSSAIADAVRQRGGILHTEERVEELIVSDGRIAGARTDRRSIEADAVLATPALPIVADLIAPHTSSSYSESLRRIDYLANVCLVLILDRSLSDTYWLNVADPAFPFVGIIEHTNFEPPESYGGDHVVYLSKYLPPQHELYHLSGEELLEFSLEHIRRMFPEFERDWIKDYFAWHARYAQPVVVPNYSEVIPSRNTPVEGVFIATMAQIFPEDRGTNYAVREGRNAARTILSELGISA